MRLDDDMSLHQMQSTAETNHRRGLCLLRCRKFIVYSGKFALDIIE